MAVLFALGHPVGQQRALAAAIVADQHQRQLYVAIQRVGVRVEGCEEGVSSRDIDILRYTGRTKRLVLVKHGSCP